MITSALPIFLTNIAKFMPASTGHVITTLSFLDEHATFGTSSEVFEVFLEILITWTFMLAK